MLTTSSFRVDTRRRLAVVCVAVLAAAIGVGCRRAAAPGDVARSPESPLPPVSVVKEPPARSGLALTAPVVLEKVTVRELRREDKVAALAPQGFFDEATAPVVIEVETAEPIDPRPRTSMPVILLNGERIKNTRPSRESVKRLCAFLPDRGKIRPRNQVAVVWLGNEELTMTEEPIAFAASDVKAAEDD